MSRARKGQGTVYKESHPTRRTKYRAEKTVRLPDGTRKRIIVRSTSFDGAADALERREKQLARAHPDAEKQTAAQYLTGWLEHHSLRVKASSSLEATRLVKRAVESFGHLRLASVRTWHVQRAVDEALSAGQPATANALRRCVKQAFSHAVRMELLARNPAEGVPPVPVPTPKRAVWQPTEAQAFMRQAHSLHGGYFALFYAAVLTGMRLGELVALLWTDVRRESISVHQTLTKAGVGPPKTKAGVRRIPIKPAAYQVIEEARAALPPSVWAFPSATGSMLSPRNVHRAFTRTLDAAELKRMRFHDIRRTTASWWAAAGVTPRVIQMLLGHATPHLALAIYTDVLEGQAESAALSPTLLLPGGSIGGNDA